MAGKQLAARVAFAPFAFAAVHSRRLRETLRLLFAAVRLRRLREALRLPLLCCWIGAGTVFAPLRTSLIKIGMN